METRGKWRFKYQQVMKDVSELNLLTSWSTFTRAPISEVIFKYYRGRTRLPYKEIVYYNIPYN